MTPLEKGARALALSQSGVDDFDALDEAFQENLKEHVRAVLEAIREPSIEMEHAAMNAARANDPVLLPPCRELWASGRIWTAMLCAALTE